MGRNAQDALGVRCRWVPLSSCRQLRAGGRAVQSLPVQPVSGCRCSGRNACRGIHGRGDGGDGADRAGLRLPAGFTFEWTDIAYQQQLAGNAGGLSFVLAVVFVFVFLAALYESLTLPLAVILIVPMCLLAAMLGVNFSGTDNNILTQIGMVVLIGLAAKNAILIVEFARQAEEQLGMTPADAAAHAARTRLRPIIMTSVAFIAGVAPLAFGSGAGAEMRHALGIAVFFGMIGVTVFGLLFTPVFYVACRRLSDRFRKKRVMPAEQVATTP